MAYGSCRLLVMGSCRGLAARFRARGQAVQACVKTQIIIPTCSPVIGQFFDTMIVASIDKEWL